MKIALVIGHDANRQGARLRDKKISEFAFWWTFVNFALLPRLTKETRHEYKIFERTTMEFGYTKKMRILHDEIDSWGADLAISFHFNGSENGRVGGYEVLYSGYEPSGELADLMTASLKKHMPTIPNRGVKRLNGSDNGFAFVKLGRAKALIIEPFFGTSSKDYSRLSGLVDGLVEFFKKV